MYSSSHNTTGLDIYSHNESKLDIHSSSEPKLDIHSNGSIIIFSFAFNHDRLCYCYGNVFGYVQKHGAMNLKRSPFLIVNFIELIAKLRIQHSLHLVSDMLSIIHLNTILSSSNLELITDVADIRSCEKIWRLECSLEPSINCKNIYKTYIDRFFHYPKNGQPCDKVKHAMINGMSYALEYPINAINLINQYREKNLSNI